MQAWAPGMGAQKLRSLLGIFQFSGEEVFKRVEVLSGGEKNRLALARLTLDPGNFLLLDEPTNHLDLPTREALEDALAGYTGTLLFVSHDRYFINKVATRVVTFEQGWLKAFRGGYDDYLEALKAGVDENAPAARMAGSRRERTPGAPAGAVPAPGTANPRPGASAATGPGEGRPRGDREARRAEAEARNRRGRELRRAQERIRSIEAKILPHETRLKEIGEALAAGETYKEPGLARSLGEEKKTLEIELAHLYDEWDEATSDLQRGESGGS